MIQAKKLLAPLILIVISWPIMALDAREIPDVLKPWINWVMEEHPDYQCPFYFNDFQQKRCSWAGQLNLALDTSRGEFNGDWTLYRPDWVTLPGDHHFWPQDVLIDQKPAIVLEREGKPAVWLPSGQHKLSGRFIWDKLPENLAIPNDSGLIRLIVKGEAIPYPRIDSGAIWLSPKQTEGSHKQENRLDLQVFRQIIDDNPLQVITRLELNVSGLAREVTLAHALLPDFIPIGLDSPLPARIEQDGRLSVQVRAGHWHIAVRARHPQALTHLDFAVDDPKWPQDELWAFQAMPALRLVEIENLASIDASQTNMPPEWRHLASYQIKQGQSMGFKVIRRGDPSPEPNQLSLTRKFWLDFDGAGYTVTDYIVGTISHDWRLNALPETQLGQVLLDGRNQLITQLNGEPGVEVRRGTLQLQADSRVQADIDTLNAVGWQQSFKQAEAELNIPPGWRLLAVTGVDNEPDSWVTRWSLLDLFLVMIIAQAISRMWSWQWGLLALFSLALFWHEADAPRWIWLNTLAALALLKALPNNRFSRWVKWYRNLCWLAMIAIVIPFMINQIRIGLYPQLENSGQPITPLPFSDALFSTQISIPKTMAALEMPAESVSGGSLMKPKSRLPEVSRAYRKIEPDSSAVNFARTDPDANLQTGPGLPQWQWHTVQLSWNGSVDDRQVVNLWYLSPPWTLMLNALQALLAALMALKMMGALTNQWKWSLPALSAWLLVILLVSPAADSFADIPDQALLEQLKTRLLKQPECLPACAVIESMTIDIEPDSMRIELQTHAQQAIALALPSQLDQWFPARVVVDGNDATLIRQDDGSLWLGLAEGIHAVVMLGPHSTTNKFTLPLPVLPEHTQVTSNGWKVDGLYENGKTGPQLEFTRLSQELNKSTQAGQTTFPAFLRIERTLQLGLDWHMTTRVVRLADSDTPVVLELPLLPGEAVTSGDVRVKDMKVLVNMAPGQHSLQWQSMLQKSEQLTLKATETTHWGELWRADVSPIWHLQFEGISAVHHQDKQGNWMPEWRPWPGESLELTITRPKAVPGPTLTIDKSQLKLQPGKRSLTADLTLNLRSTKGGQHSIQLPADAVLQNVQIDGVSQPVRQKGNTVTLPIRPGAQEIALNWQTNQGQAMMLTTPVINLAIDSVNSHIQVLEGDDRWILFTYGPKFGPAALIWGLLIVLLLTSLGLGQVPLTPLKSQQWFLLLIGLSQLHVVAAMTVVAWLFALGLRGHKAPDGILRFNLLQIGLALFTLCSVLLIFSAIQQGLLGSPNMQISGNQSTATDLNWYQDRTGTELPIATIVSLPKMTYLLLMLCWSFWMAISLLDWLRNWGWGCFVFGGLWRKKPVSQAQPDSRK
ncbi:MAG: hypothetical protein ACU836_09320 [Gammaproteobacteria bacterium]